MNLNKTALLCLLLSRVIVPMGHAQRNQDITYEQTHDKKENKVRSIVQDYVAFTKSQHIDQTTAERAKQEYEKSKGNPLVQVVNKLTRPKEGLLGTTVVKTESGYRKMAELKVGDSITCYDFKSQKETVSKVTYADRVQVKKHIQITINDQTVHVSPSHKFYVESWNMWVTASDLKNNLDLRKIVDPNITDVQEIKEALDVVRITVDQKHNYFITDHNILVHNFVIEGTVLWGIGEGAVFTWAILKPTLVGLSFLGLGLVGHKVTSQNKASSHLNQPPRMVFDWDALQRDLPADQRHPSWVAKNTPNETPQAPKTNNNGGGAPEGPNKNDKDKKKDTEFITNKEAEKAAKELGFEKTNYQSKGRPVFKQGNKYITPDRARHNGGFWKMASSVEELFSKTSRLGTFSRNLTKIGN